MKRQHLDPLHTEWTLLIIEMLLSLLKKEQKLRGQELNRKFSLVVLCYIYDCETH